MSQDSNVNQQLIEKVKHYRKTASVEKREKIRINYKSKSGIEGIGLWVFKDAKNPSYNWPKGAFTFSVNHYYKDSYYLDVKLSEDFEELGLIIVDRNTGGKLTQDIIINKDMNINGEIYLKENDNEVYLNRHFINHNNYLSAKNYQLKDELFYYKGDDLGSVVLEDETVLFKVWAPTADDVFTVLYDKEEPEIEIAIDIPMERNDLGVFQGKVHPKDLDLTSLEGYYYQYKIARDGRYRYVLDPYGKSMAPWNFLDGNKTGKSAIIKDIKADKEKNLKDYTIENFRNKEDAIIYEASIRDFTSDPSIKDELKNEFKTFGAFGERLDYIKELGVTHIELLPIMSFYTANETKDRERILQYNKLGTDYNWGYDPFSYFSITGLYSKDPHDPKKRLYEFKKLVDEIHKKGMGIILDVVYNHTARVHLLKALEPNYYYFMDSKGKPKTSFGGGRLGTTHKMSRKLLIDSIKYFTKEFNIDGFRFDMMGDHDSKTIDEAYIEAKKINPRMIFIGEGWRTYAGDDGDREVVPADQDWIKYTESVGSFSDEFRNELKSGYGSEGKKRFLTGGKRNINKIFNNIKAMPSNFSAKRPSGIVNYIESHDNLTLHDVIAKSIMKDPKDHEGEIQKRIRLGNLILLTSQGIPFIHSGQEYGRTKHFKKEGYEGKVNEPPYKSTLMVDIEGNSFDYPYYLHDSYKASDALNKFQWKKVRDKDKYQDNIKTKEYMKGLIKLRKKSKAFSYSSYGDINLYVKRIFSYDIEDKDLVIAYSVKSREREETFYIFINGDNKERKLELKGNINLNLCEAIVDSEIAGIDPIISPKGFKIEKENKITIEPLTGIVFKKRSL